MVRIHDVTPPQGCIRTQRFGHNSNPDPSSSRTVSFPQPTPDLSSRQITSRKILPIDLQLKMHVDLARAHLMYGKCNEVTSHLNTVAMLTINHPRNLTSEILTDLKKMESFYHQKCKTVVSTDEKVQSFTEKMKLYLDLANIYNAYGDQENAEKYRKLALHSSMYNPEEMTSELHLAIAELFIEMQELNKYALYFRIAYRKDPTFFSTTSIEDYQDYMVYNDRTKEFLEFIEKDVRPFPGSLAYMEAVHFLLNYPQENLSLNLQEMCNTFCDHSIKEYLNYLDETQNIDNALHFIEKEVFRFPNSSAYLEAINFLLSLPNHSLNKKLQDELQIYRE